MAKILSASYLRKIVNIKNQYKFIRSFISTATLSGIQLFLVTVLAVYIANSMFAPQYFELLKHILASLWNTHFSMSLQHWINDVLMALFFLSCWSWNKKRYASRWAFKSKKSIISYNCSTWRNDYSSNIVSKCKSISSNRIWNSMAEILLLPLGILMLLGKRVSLSLKKYF